MNKIERLIEKLCPNGVEWKTLGEVCALNRHKQIGASELEGLNSGRGSIKLLPSSRNYDWWCMPTADVKKFVCHGKVIAMGRARYANTKYFEGDFISSNNFLIESIDEREVSSRYLYHYIAAKEKLIYIETSTYPKFDVDSFKKIEIPVPPLEVQGEIVQILDNFANLKAELEANLEAELAARIKQYQQYRDTLLTMKSGTPYFALSEVCDYVDYRGKTPKKTEKGVFLVTAKNIKKGYIDYESSREYISDADYEEVMHRGKPQLDDVLITTEAPCGNVALVDRTDIALAQRVIKYRPKDKRLNSKFLKFYLLGREFQDELNRQATGGTVKGIKGSKLHQMSIPLPPLAEQERIVGILDKFDKLVNSLTEGLPAEISARQKQYEYYRDKLLSFGKEAK